MKKGDLNSIGKKLCWVDLLKPTKAEISELSKRTGISIADIKDCLDPKEIPRVQTNNNYIFIIFRTPLNEYGGTFPLGIFYSRKYFVTVHSHEIKPVNEMFASESVHTIFKDGADSMAYNLLLKIIKEFSIILDELGDKLENIENKMLEGGNKKDMKAIFHAKKTILYIRRSLISNREVANIVEKQMVINKKQTFNDLYIEVIQMVEITEMLRERLTGVLEIYLSSESNRLNQVMKSFTVIAALLLMPTLISGIYGMNFKVLPLSTHPFGFWISLLIMFFTVFLMIIFFRKKDWI